jgi:hypothetical protein
MRVLVSGGPGCGGRQTGAAIVGHQQVPPRGLQTFQAWPCPNSPLDGLRRPPTRRVHRRHHWLASAQHGGPNAPLPTGALHLHALRCTHPRPSLAGIDLGSHGPASIAPKGALA